MWGVYGSFLDRYERYRDDLALSGADDALLLSAAQTHQDQLQADGDAAEEATVAFCARLDFSKSAVSIGRTQDRIFHKRLKAVSIRAENLLASLSDRGRSSVDEIIESIAAETRTITTKTDAEVAAEDPALFKYNLAINCAVLADGISREKARAKARNMYDAGVFGRVIGDSR